MIVARTRKNDSKAFTAPIVIKKGGAIVHREPETFDRKQAANAWILKREAELKRPDGLERKGTFQSRLSAVKPEAHQHGQISSGLSTVGVICGTGWQSGRWF